MAVLHLGVIDVPYTDDTEGTTTGDVAEILEARYHVMEIFAQENGAFIADAVTKSYMGALESELMGGPSGAAAPLVQAETDIEAQFKAFLSNGDMERLGYPGVPTQAAIDRRSARFKKKRGPNKRPSFIDTGQYQASFKVWGDSIPGMTEYGWGFSGLEGLYA